MVVVGGGYSGEVHDKEVERRTWREAVIRLMDGPGNELR